MNPARLQTFAAAYEQALTQAVKDLRPALFGKSAVEYVKATLANTLAMVESDGVAAIEHYLLNTRGGAIRLTCEVLGLPNKVRALQDYLEGG